MSGINSKYIHIGNILLQCISIEVNQQNIPSINYIEIISYRQKRGISMKSVRKFVVFAICVALLFSMQTSTFYHAVFADSMNLAEQKVYSTATLDDAFADNRILEHFFS